MIERNKYTIKYWYNNEWVDNIPVELKPTDFKEIASNLKYQVIPTYF